MCIMTCEDSDRVDVRVVDHLVIVRCGILETKLFARVLGMESTRRGDANKFNVTSLFDGRKQDRVSEETSAQDAKFAGGRFECRGIKPCHFRTFQIFNILRIRKYYTEELFFLLPRNDFIRLCGLANV